MLSLLSRQLMPGQPQLPDPSALLDAEKNEVEITAPVFIVPEVEPRLEAHYREISRQDLKIAHFKKGISSLLKKKA